jgi:S-adenosylmethionine hydrolase
MTPPRITLLTDFGTRDGFVGAVKGVLASLAPGALVEDVAHDLPRGDVAAAARALARYWSRHPAGTVHLVVVDPGVGTVRRALACASAGRFLVGPDNGVLTPALRDGGARCVRLDPARLSRSVSPTFHGRDLFAPAAAALAAGGALHELGDLVTDPVLLPDPTPVRSERGGDGVVVAVDHFGNLTTNLPGGWGAPGDVVELAGWRVELLRTYGDAPTGGALALVDSEGRIEVAVRDGSAARLLGVTEGAPARLVKR